MSQPWTRSVVAPVLLVLLSGCVTIPLPTQRALAVQSSEATLAKGLASYVKAQPANLVTAEEQLRAASLYNDAVRDNNAVVNQLVLQLSHRGAGQVILDDMLALTAIKSLLAFRKFAQDISSLPDISPIDPEAVLEAPGRGGVLDSVVTAALEAIRWWFAENERQRMALIERIETYHMPPWHELPAAH